MNSAITRMVFGSLVLAIVFTISSVAQQDTGPVQGHAGQASQPAAASNGPGNPAPTPNTAPPSASSATSPENPPKTTTNANATGSTSTSSSAEAADDNPYDPLLEPPPLPQGKPTLIGGIATSVDHVRNHLTVQPFGGGKKIKVFVDERSHIYRNGMETTVLGVRKGDRVYLDTMLDGSKIFAKNVRALTESGLAEVRGQVIGTNPDKGTISVRDQLSAKPVTVAVSGATKYSSSKGAAVAGDVQAGSLIDVQFSPGREAGAVAQEITVLAKPGDNYIFSGVVTNLDMRADTLSLENGSDGQPYEIQFNRASVSDSHALKVGSEVTARATFDGKVYKASNVRIEKSNEEGEQSKAQ